ncbi:hypothetical protein ACIBHX_07140 [Nonomuraea sp. NPDC050536]|uniref:hypothetical protein n=1 Tax=Nonomuraea sp. NPDC050536 TaxID=3364366 RepID=UPI0037C86775
MKRLIKSSAIAAVSLGLAAAIAGPALAQPGPIGSTDSLSMLLGTSRAGGALLGQGQSPLMSLITPVNQIAQSKDPVDGTMLTLDKAARSVDGTAQLLPQGDLRNGLPVSDVSNVAGIRTVSGTPIMGAAMSPFTLSLLDGPQVVGVAQNGKPVPGTFSAISGRAGRVVHAPAMRPVTTYTVRQVTERLAITADQADTVTRTLGGAARTVSSRDTLGGPAEGVKSALPDTLSTELVPVLGAPLERHPMRARGVPGASMLALDEIAPLVEGTVTMATGSTTGLTKLTAIR